MDTVDAGNGRDRPEDRDNASRPGLRAGGRHRLARLLMAAKAGGVLGPAKAGGVLGPAKAGGVLEAAEGAGPRAPSRVVLHRFIVPVLVALLVNLAITFALFLAATSRADDYAWQNGRKILALALQDARTELALLTYDYAFWEDTATHAVLDHDQPWMAANLGLHLTKTHHVRVSAVVGPDGAIVQAFKEGEATRDGLEELRLAMAPVVARLGVASGEPVADSAIIRIGRTLYFVGACLIFPEVGGVERLDAIGRHALVLMRSLDDAHLATLEERLGLTGLRVLTVAEGGPEAPENTSHGVIVEGPVGETLGWLAWSPESPGWSLLRRALVPLFMLTVSVGWVIVWIIRRAVVLEHLQEATAQAREAAEEANRAKSRFLAMISHEVRTPLSAIMGSVDLLLTSPLSEEQRHIVETMRGSAQAQLSMLNDLLDFSKFEAGRLVLEEIEFDIVRLVEEVARLFERSARDKGLTLTFSLPPDVPWRVRGDPTRLRQILFNLVANAIKFTGEGSVAVRLADARREEDAVVLRFEVADTGIGITDDQRDHLFNPFIQADQSTARRFGGTGLGLAICKRLVEAMAGDIGVVSQPGDGSTFWFTVRLKTGGAVGCPAISAGPTMAAGAGRPDDAPAAPGLRLLLAEDSRANRLLIAAMLRRLGHRVEAVEDGVQAVAAATAGEFDVVLMDLRMPGMDGAGAVRAIRALPGAAGRVPIVALTADALSDQQERHAALRFDGYVTKPVDWAYLSRVLAELTGRTSSPAGLTPLAPDPSPAEPPLLDERRWRGMGGRERRAVVLGLLAGSARREVEAMRAAHRTGDGEALRRATAALAELAADFGFPRVQAATRAVREGQGGPEAIETRIAALGDFLERTLEATAER